MEPWRFDARLDGDHVRGLADGAGDGRKLHAWHQKAAAAPAVQAHAAAEFGNGLGSKPLAVTACRGRPAAGLEAFMAPLWCWMIGEKPAAPTTQSQSA